MAETREGRRPAWADDEDDDDLDPPLPARRRIQAPRLRRRAPVEESGRETVMRLVKDIPSFLKLLYRLARDPRVSAADKAIVAATIGYVIMPFDFVPDFIPFLGQVDDVYLLALAMSRLLNNAGIDVLLDHWDGEEASLEAMLAGLDKAGAFLPERVRSLLGSRVR